MDQPERSHEDALSVRDALSVSDEQLLHLIAEASDETEKERLAQEALRRLRGGSEAPAPAEPTELLEQARALRRRASQTAEVAHETEHNIAKLAKRAPSREAKDAQRTASEASLEVERLQHAAHDVDARVEDEVREEREE